MNDPNTTPEELAAAAKSEREDFLSRRLAQLDAQATALPDEEPKNEEAAPVTEGPDAPPLGLPGANLGPALAEGIVIFHTICGARRIEIVNEPWGPPPPFLDVQTVKARVLQVPGADPGAAYETRRFDFVQTVQVGSLGMSAHLYKERF